MPGRVMRSRQETTGGLLVGIDGEAACFCSVVIGLRCDGVGPVIVVRRTAVYIALAMATRWCRLWQER